MWLGAYGMCVMLCVDGVSVRCGWRQLNYNNITQDGLLPPILTRATGVMAQRVSLGGQTSSPSPAMITRPVGYRCTQSSDLP